MALDGPIKTAIARTWDACTRLTGAHYGLTILYYHAVPSHLRSSFEDQMHLLREEADLLFADELPRPDSRRPTVAITFDDAFGSVADNALPILGKLGIPVTIFAPSGWLGRVPGWRMESGHDQGECVMDAVALRSIQSPMVRIGAHSVDHLPMAELSGEAAFRQASDSRKALEDICGVAVDEFAFPYGSLDDAALDAVGRAGYRHAYSVTPQTIRAGGHAMLRGRTAAEPSDGLDLFRLKMAGAFAWMPLASALKRAIRLRRG